MHLVFRRLTSEVGKNACAGICTHFRAQIPGFDVPLQDEATANAWKVHAVDPTRDI